MNSAELQWQFMRAVWLGGALLVAAFCGLLLGVAGQGYILLYVFAPIVWLTLLPYHGRISMTLVMATFGSGFVVPFVPGRPYLWEAASLLAWSGVVVSLALREQSPEFKERFRRNWTIYAGGFSYCVVLLFIMRARGVGFSVFGGALVGGRLYFQQIIVAVIPLLFALLSPTPETLLRLFKIQCVLSASFLVADLALAAGGEVANSILYFVELPTDGLNFEIQALSGGLRRFQSLFNLALGLLCFLWTRYPLVDYFKSRALWLWPVTLALVFMGLFSGHRMLLYLFFSVLLVLGWAQRIFSPPRIAMALTGLAFVYLILFAFAKDLPLGVQRPISAVPGIEVERLPREDARATIEGRNAIRSAGWSMARNFRLIGRGFHKESLDPSRYHDLTDFYVDNGMFFNGTVGLLVNTGIPGTVAISLLFIGGSVACVRIFKLVRNGAHRDEFGRMCAVVASLWTANLTSFIFLHGDSEFAMRQYAIPAAMLLAGEHHLRKREARLALAGAVPVAAPDPDGRRIHTRGAGWPSPDLPFRPFAARNL